MLPDPQSPIFVLPPIENLRIPHSGMGSGSATTELLAPRKRGASMCVSDVEQTVRPIATVDRTHLHCHPHARWSRSGLKGSTRQVVYLYFPCPDLRSRTSMVDTWRSGQITPVGLISPEISRTIPTSRVPGESCTDAGGLVGGILRRYRFVERFERVLQETRHFEVRRESATQCLKI